MHFVSFVEPLELIHFIASTGQITSGLKYGCLRWAAMYTPTGIPIIGIYSVTEIIKYSYGVDFSCEQALDSPLVYETG